MVDLLDRADRRAYKAKSEYDLVKELTESIESSNKGNTKSARDVSSMFGILYKKIDGVEIQKSLRDEWR